MITPEFVVAGHFARDLVDGGWRPGGAVTYAGLTASRLGVATAVVTACAVTEVLEEALPGIAVHRLASHETTLMQNEYKQDGTRRQMVPAVAGPMSCEDIPDAWRGAMVLFAPIIGEFTADAGTCVRGDVALGLQGFLRNRHSDGAITPRPFALEALPPANVVFLSEDDLAPADRDRALPELSLATPIVVVTRGAEGAVVLQGGVLREIDAFPAAPVDPTGAGDVFAAAFLTGLLRGCDVAEAARWGACAGAFAVEGAGTATLPDRAALEARLAAHPEITLR